MSRVESSSPYNFSWVVDNRLAAMAWPKSKGNLEYLYEKGIRHLVTLSPEKVPPIKEFPNIEWTLIAIEEFGAPSLRDMMKFIDICQRSQQKNQPVGVHSRMGKDRAGIMAACYLIRFCNLNPESALNELRTKRPRSIEDPELETVINSYYEKLKGDESSGSKQTQNTTIREKPLNV